MKYAFICDTPYQILSVLAYVYDNQDKIDSSDLYVEISRCQNADMLKLINNIEEKHIFTNVYGLESLPLKHKRIEKILKAYEWMCPKSSFLRSLCSNVDVKSKKYDIIGMSGPFTLNRNFLEFSPHANVIFLEDGSGSYSGRIGVNLLSWRGKLIQKILKRGPSYVRPQNVYLYCPEMYNGEYQHILKTLKFPHSKMLLLKNLFNIKSVSEYENANLIYLSQPAFLNEHAEEIDNTVVSILEKFKANGMIVRPHPQEVNKDFGNLSVDRSGKQWEIVCGDCVTNNDILVAKYSTAQLTPKLIFDKEPYLVFTYKMYRYKDSRIESGINFLKNIYNDSSKIKCISNANELEKILIQYIERGD